jgi:acyl-coenzyme A synthetase/AMP-(fatty) acid ligase
VIDALSDAYARGLRRRGIEAGMRTILMVPASPELFAIVFALIKIGAIPIVVDPGMGIRRMLHCYAKTQATAFVGIPIAHVIRRLAPRTFASLRIALSPSGLAEPSDELFAIAKTAPDDLLMINFTTGSTGPAKGVRYTHAMADAMCSAVRRSFGHGPADTSLATLPLFAIFDLLLGATSVLPPMDPTKPARADAAAMIDAIERFGATTMFASPAFLRRVGDYARRRRVLL